MATFEHPTLQLKLVLKDDLLTRDVEAYMRELRTMAEKARSSPLGGLMSFEENAIVVRAAIKAGWVLDPQMSWGQVGDLPAVHTRWYAQQISGLVLELTEVPKD